MTGQSIPAKLLEQRWIHSHEEDTDTEMVFRPASFNFPRSRGRSGFELRPDHSLVEIGIGATDAPAETQGKWNISADGTLNFYPERTAGEKTLKVASVEANRLVIAR